MLAETFQVSGMDSLDSSLGARLKRVCAKVLPGENAMSIEGRMREVAFMCVKRDSGGNENSSNRERLETLSCCFGGVTKSRLRLRVQFRRLN